MGLIFAYFYCILEWYYMPSSVPIASLPPLKCIITQQNETEMGANIGQMRQSIGQIFFVGQGVSGVLAKTYFKRIYPRIRADVYYPSMKNSGIFVTRCFCAAGSNHFPFKKGKRYTSGDVPLQRKLYDGSRTMTSDIKDSFHPFDVDGLATFYKESIEDSKFRDVMVSFGLPPTIEENVDCFCKALAIQFQMFVNSDTDEADDIVAMEYQKLIAEPQAEANESYRPVTVLYPGDQLYFKTRPRPTYQVNIYERFQHTWEFENIGTQVWHGRRLYFSNHESVRPRAEANYIDIPDTPPHKGIKITVSVDARGFEGKTECKWIMIDQDGNDCFPNSSTFSFVVCVRFEYDKDREVIQ